MLLPDLGFYSEQILAASDPDAAARALLIIAKRLRSGVALRPEVVEFLAGAIERSMTQPQKKRGPTLLREFNLTYGGRRPVKAHYWEVGKNFDQLIGSGEKRSDAIIDVAVAYNIDESTVVRMLKDYSKAVKEDDRIKAEFVAEFGEDHESRE